MFVVENARAKVKPDVLLLFPLCCSCLSVISVKYMFVMMEDINSVQPLNCFGLFRMQNHVASVALLLFYLVLKGNNSSHSSFSLQFVYSHSYTTRVHKRD